MKNFIILLTLLFSFQISTQAQPPTGETVEFTNNTHIYFVGAFTDYPLGPIGYIGNYWYDIPYYFSYDEERVVNQGGAMIPVAGIQSLAIWDFYGSIGGAKFSIDLVGSVGSETFSSVFLAGKLLRVSWVKGLNPGLYDSVHITFDLI